MMICLAPLCFRVKDDSYSTFYKVYIQKIQRSEITFGPMQLALIIWVIYAGMKQLHLFQLQEMIDKNMLNADDVEYDQRHTVAKMKFIDLKSFACFHRRKYLPKQKNFSDK